MASAARSMDWDRNRHRMPNASAMTASKSHIETGREAAPAVAIPTRKASEIQKRGRGRDMRAILPFSIYPD